MKINQIVLISTLLAITSCGVAKKSDDSAKSPAMGPLAEAGLAGSAWAEDCFAGESYLSYRSSYEFTASTLVATFKSYDGQECAQDRVFFEESVTYGQIEFEKSQELEGWKVMPNTLLSYIGMIRVQEDVAGFNKGAVFGYTDWAVNVPKDIAGKSWKTGSKPRRAAGEKLVRTLKVEGDSLFFATYGENGLVSLSDPTPAKRVK